jgi:hypothetical protein
LPGSGRESYPMEADLLAIVLGFVAFAALLALLEVLDRV